METSDKPASARLIRQSDKKEFPLSARLTTMGSSPQSGIVVSSVGVVEHVAHILFSDGVFSLAAVSRVCAVMRNGKRLVKPTVLADGDLIGIADELFLFKNEFQEVSAASAEKSPLRGFIAAVSKFMRTGSGDARFELLSAVAQLLCSDGARLVVEEPEGGFTTIARFPQASALDRFSQRAILWAKQQQSTVLMHDESWGEDDQNQGSLEKNQIGSILCSPIFEGEAIRGYLYLDKKRNKTGFSQQDREILDDAGPIFGDLLALYDRSVRQRETIVRLQTTLDAQTAPIIYDCEVMQRAIDLSIKFSSTDSSVLLMGETGTGKELFARFIHGRGNRADKDFCAINCGALPENLIESELFGHEKGAFTGAYQKKRGLFERARGGTVFLDEIGEMPLNLQVKLLRVLQESEMTPVGSTETVRVDVRVIAATNKDLREEVMHGRFREDLFYRLNVLEIIIPALRLRVRDALLLTDYFIKKYSQRFGLQEKGLTLQAQAKLLGYRWPGNVRQLENVIQKALLISKDKCIDETDIDLPQGKDSGDAHKEQSGQTLKEVRAAAEAQCIKDALAKANGNVSIAARLLEIDRKWLTKLIKAHHLSTVP